MCPKCGKTLEERADGMMICPNAECKYPGITKTALAAIQRMKERQAQNEAR